MEWKLTNVADRDTSRLSAERTWYLFFKKGDEYTENSMLEEHDRVMCYWNRLVVSEVSQGNLTPGTISNIDNFLEDSKTKVIEILMAQ